MYPIPGPNDIPVVKNIFRSDKNASELDIRSIIVICEDGTDYTFYHKFRLGYIQPEHEDIFYDSQRKVWDYSAVRSYCAQVLQKVTEFQNGLPFTITSLKNDFAKIADSVTADDTLKDIPNNAYLEAQVKG